MAYVSKDIVFLSIVFRPRRIGKYIVRQRTTKNN